MLEIIKKLYSIDPRTKVTLFEKERPFLVCEEKSLFGDGETYMIFNAKDFDPDLIPFDISVKRILVIERNEKNPDNTSFRSESADDNFSPKQKKGPKVHRMSFRELRNILLPMEEIKKALHDPWNSSYSNEEKDWYVKPNAVSENSKTTDRIHNLASKYMSVNSGDEKGNRIEIKEQRGGLVYILGGYGVGKTMFCRNFVFEVAANLENAPCIPFLFDLNEYDAGSFKSYIKDQLSSRYKIPFSFDEFAELVNLGVFSICLDAFDQMHADANRRLIESDYYHIKNFAQKSGQVLLTCRLYYHREYLQRLDEKKSVEIETGTAGVIRDVLRLTGFDGDELKQYAKNREELNLVLNLPAFNNLIKKHQSKPLLIKIIADHTEQFINLAVKINEKSEISDYDVFNMSYEAWLNSNLGILETETRRKQALRYLILEVTERGINQACPFEKWLEKINVAPNKPITNEKVDALIEDLCRLPFLDSNLLTNQDKPSLFFLYPPYLEFLTARFVIDELKESHDRPSILKEVCMTPDARKMAVSAMNADLHGPELAYRIKKSKSKNFASVKYEASNSASLIVEAIRMSKTEDWKKRFNRIRFERTILKGADFSEADLSGFDFNEADLSECDFSYCNLKRANMEFSNMEGALFNEHGHLLTSSIFFNGPSSNPIVVGGTSSGLVVTWNIREQRMAKRIQLHSQPITALKKFGGSIITGSGDGFITICSLDDSQSKRVINPDLRGICALAVQGFPNRVLAVGESGSVSSFLMDDPIPKKIFERNPSRMIEGGTGPIPWLTALDVTEDRGILLGHADGTIQLIEDWKYNDADVVLVGQIEGEVASIHVIGKNLAIVNNIHGTVYTVKLGNGTALNPEPLGVRGRYIAVAEGKGEVYFLFGEKISFGPVETAINNPEMLYQANCRIKGKTLAVSRDGDFVAVGGNTLVVMDRRKGFEEVFNEDMHLKCSGMVVNHAKNLSTENLVFLLGRGALIPPDNYLRNHIDLDEVKLDRNRREYWYGGEKRLLSSNTKINGRILQ